MSYQSGEPSERGYPKTDRSRSPAGRDSDEREPPRAGFTRGGFAPIPHRHMDIPPPPLVGRYEPEEWDRPRGREREFPRRELDPEPEWERRGDWEELDRRNRGRPAPPHWDDDYDRPKRRRSPSPVPPSHRPRLHSPSPPRYPPSNHNLPDPASIESLLPFRSFAEWFRASHPQTAKNDEDEVRRFREQLDSGMLSEAEAKEKVGMAKRYERYRKEYTSRQLYALFLTHRESVWFEERYSVSSEYIALRRRLNRQGRVPTAEKYLDVLRSGAFDSANFTMDAESEGGLRRQNENDEPEGLDRALGDKADWVGDEGLRVEIAPSARQIFVKTAPPTTSRKSLEELFASVPGFQWLAISEPSQKRSFHRVAWAQYAEGVNLEEVVQKLDATKIDGFTFHMSINSTPTIGRLRITPAVANSLERLRLDGEQAKALALKLEEELLGDDDEPEVGKAEDEEEAIKKEPLQTSVQGLREKASDVVEEMISRLLSNEGLTEDEPEEDRKTRRARIIADQWISYLRHGLSTCYYCVAPTSFAEELHRKCIGHIRPHPSDRIEKPEPEPEAIPNGETAEPESKSPIDAEDRETRDQDERAASDRKVIASGNVTQGKKGSLFPQKTQDEKWVENLDQRIKPLLGEVDLAQYGGRDLEDETRKLTAPLIKQEEPSKYRCKDCNKLFRAPEFVIKHIAVKHPEVTKTKLDEISLLNNFVLDPQHLQPGPSTLAAVDDKLVTPYSSETMFNFPNAGISGSTNGIAGNGGGPLFNPALLANGAGSNQGFNMMQQQMMMMMQMQQAMMMGMGGGGGPGPALAHTGQGGAGLSARIGGYAHGPSTTVPAADIAAALPLPPAPAGGEDPRARRGRVSYQDLDEPGGSGDGGLPY